MSFPFSFPCSSNSPGLWTGGDDVVDDGSEDEDTTSFLGPAPMRDEVITADFIIIDVVDGEELGDGFTTATVLPPLAPSADDGEEKEETKLFDPPDSKWVLFREESELPGATTPRGADRVPALIFLGAVSSLSPLLFLLWPSETVLAWEEAGTEGCLTCSTASISVSSASTPRIAVSRIMVETGRVTVGAEVVVVEDVDTATLGCDKDFSEASRPESSLA